MGSSQKGIAGISTEYSIDYSGIGLRPDVDLALLRIGQEAINNARRHSGSSKVILSLSKVGKVVTLRIQDDGRGFDKDLPGEDQRTGFGLTSMRERAISIGANLTVEPTPGKGTRIEVVVENATG